MRASSGRVERGHSQSVRDTPESQVPRAGGAIRTGGEEEEEREGGQGGGCSCGPSLPTCSSAPEQAAQLVRNQAAPASIEPRGRGSPPTGGPGAPWMWLRRRLHLIPFAEQADPSVKPPRDRGRTEGERREDGGEGRRREEERGTV